MSRADFVLELFAILSDVDDDLIESTLPPSWAPHVPDNAIPPPKRRPLRARRTLIAACIGSVLVVLIAALLLLSRTNFYDPPVDTGILPMDSGHVTEPATEDSDEGESTGESESEGEDESESDAESTTVDETEPTPPDMPPPPVEDAVLISKVSGTAHATLTGLQQNVDIYLYRSESADTTYFVMRDPEDGTLYNQLMFGGYVTVFTNLKGQYGIVQFCPTVTSEGSAALHFSALLIEPSGHQASPDHQPTWRLSSGGFQLTIERASQFRPYAYQDALKDLGTQMARWSTCSVVLSTDPAFLSSSYVDHASHSTPEDLWSFMNFDELWEQYMTRTG